MIARHAVTNKQYLAFLNDLLASGKEQQALRWAPRELTASDDREGTLLYDRDANGQFVLQAAPGGHAWQLDWPVMMVDWYCAMAYGRWYAEKTKQPWRVPYELEWAKAARGVDGRVYPWGNWLDPSWCCMRESSKNPGPTSVCNPDFAVDRSPYGVRDMAGNIMEWCADVFADVEAYKRGPEAPHNHNAVAPPHDTADEQNAAEAKRVFCGGAWFNFAHSCRSAERVALGPRNRYRFLGLRLARPLPPRNDS